MHRFCLFLIQLTNFSLSEIKSQPLILKFHPTVEYAERNRKVRNCSPSFYKNPTRQFLKLFYHFQNSLSLLQNFSKHFQLSKTLLQPPFHKNTLKWHRRNQPAHPRKDKTQGHEQTVHLRPSISQDFTSRRFAGELFPQLSLLPRRDEFLTVNS